MSEIKENIVLNKQEALLAATSLLRNPNTAGFYLKAMHWELPPVAQTENAAWHEPVMALEILTRGIQHALKCGIPGTVILDAFTTLFENDKFHFSAPNGNGHSRPRMNARSLESLMQLERTHPHFALQIVNFAPQETHFGRALRGVLEGQLHVVADAIPGLPLNVMRNRDHRKGVIIQQKDGSCVLFLNTFNFDKLNDTDCSLVVRDPRLIQTVREHFDQPTPRNSIVHGDGWHFYQDGGVDLDPEAPEQSSPILARVIELLKDPRTEEILWSSKFLPDFEDLRIIEQRLKNRTLKKVTILAPDNKYSSQFYLLSGGNASQQKALQLAAEYPEAFQVIFSKEKCVHAKVIVTNGTQLIIGSHNFNRTLVRAKTSEIMLEMDEMPDITRTSLMSIFRNEFGVT
jgi:hypothetical protein